MPPKPNEGSKPPKKFAQARIQAGRQIPSAGPSSSGPSSTSKGTAATAAWANVGKGNDASIKSMAGLPAALDIEKFAMARSFEITAMKTAMKTASESAAKRAFQTLPRHLRRRAASHNARRVPSRLRAKAAAEIDSKTAPIKKHYPKKKITRKTGLTRTERLRRRQRSKIWLETHIWMAKRMHMINTWGFRLAHRPTEKSFRPNHRASIHGSILNDVSYFSLVELKGEEAILEKVLKKVSGEVCWGKRFSSGARMAQTTLHKSSAFPLQLLCPAQIIWCPPPSAQSPIPPTSASSKASTSKIPLPTSPKPFRQLWVRFHPSCHAEVWGSLRSAITYVLEEEAAVAAESKGKGRASKEVDGQEEKRVELNDVRESVCAFEMFGAKVGRVLKGALGGMVKSERREETQKIWSKLGDLKTAGNIPGGMVMGFDVYDPRLSFPPKNPVPSEDHAEKPWQLEPSSVIARSGLWDEETRRELRRKKIKKVELDKRRQALDNPGQPLRPLAQDARLPLLLIQQSLTPSPSSTFRNTSLHGFLILLPNAYAQPFLTSLTFTGTRVGGIRERASQALESGAGGFPQDWAGTRASRRWWNEKEVDEKSRWEKKPKGKRVGWGSVGWGFGVLGGPEQVEEEPVADGEGADSAMAAPPGEMEAGRRGEKRIPRQVGRSPWKPDWTSLIPNRSPALTPWLLRSPVLSSSLLPTLLLASTSSDPSTSAALRLLETINAIRHKRSLPPLPTSDADAIFQSALVRVTVTMLGRGVAGDVGPIYFVDDPEVERRWRDGFAAGKKGRDIDRDDDAEIPLPSSYSMIGFQTSGSFSLSRGHGHGIASLPLSTLLTLLQQDVEAGRTRSLPDGSMVGRPQELLNLVMVRGRESTVVRAATLELLD